jgi:hypothetical protein
MNVWELSASVPFWHQPGQAPTAIDRAATVAFLSPDGMAVEIWSLLSEGGEGYNYRVPVVRPPTLLSLGRGLLLIGDSDSVEVWQITSSDPMKIAYYQLDGVVACGVSHDEPLIAVVCHDGHIRVFDTTSSEPEARRSFQSSLAAKSSAHEILCNFTDNRLQLVLADQMESFQLNGTGPSTAKVMKNQAPHNPLLVQHNSRLQRVEVWHSCQTLAASSMPSLILPGAVYSNVLTFAREFGSLLLLRQIDLLHPRLIQLAAKHPFRTREQLLSQRWRQGGLPAAMHTLLFHELTLLYQRADDIIKLKQLLAFNTPGLWFEVELWLHSATAALHPTAVLVAFLHRHMHLLEIADFLKTLALVPTKLYDDALLVPNPFLTVASEMRLDYSVWPTTAALQGLGKSSLSTESRQYVRHTGAPSCCRAIQLEALSQSVVAFKDNAVYIKLAGSELWFLLLAIEEVEVTSANFCMLPYFVDD